ncbi:MAG: hypothetical protein U9O96_07605 [Candidatus Thermoplasmatota archaeon]|nr:hypothetical protein [Candidatus Thermoplasmatota archaeon]
MEEKWKCPKCGSNSMVVVLRVPWSTDGLTPEQCIFLECRDCGYAMPLRK